MIYISPELTAAIFFKQTYEVKWRKVLCAAEEES